MKTAIGSLIGLVWVVCAAAEPLIEGWVRLDSGEPVAAQVQIFDLADLRRGAIAHATTDGTGYFALPWAALTGQALPARFALGPNYPNPFNPSTIIPYQHSAPADSVVADSKAVEEGRPVKRKNPYIAGALSAIWLFAAAPSLFSDSMIPDPLLPLLLPIPSGQIYNGQYLKAALFMGATGFGLYLIIDNLCIIGCTGADEGLADTGFNLIVASGIGSIFDAAISAMLINRQAKESKQLSLYPVVGRNLSGARLTLRF